MQFRLTVTFAELSGETITDLSINSKEEVVPLQIRECANQGVCIEGLTETIIKSRKEFLSAIKRGARSRYSKERLGTKSHAILQFTVEQRWLEKLPDCIKVTPT